MPNKKAPQRGLYVFGSETSNTCISPLRITVKEKIARVIKKRCDPSRAHRYLIWFTSLVRAKKKSRDAGLLWYDSAFLNNSHSPLRLTVKEIAKIKESIAADSHTYCVVLLQTYIFPLRQQTGKSFFFRYPAHDLLTYKGSNHTPKPCKTLKTKYLLYKQVFSFATTSDTFIYFAKAKKI